MATTNQPSTRKKNSQKSSGVRASKVISAQQSAKVLGRPGRFDVGQMLGTPSQESALMYEEFLKLLQAWATPFEVEGVRIPSASGHMTVAAKVMMPIHIDADANGRACMAVMPDISRFLFDSQTDIGRGAADPALAYGAGGWYLKCNTNGAVNNPTNPTTLYSVAQPVPNLAMIQNMYSHFRVAGMGLVANSIGAIGSVKGNIAASLVPWPTTMPASRHDVVIADGITFEEFRNMRYTTTNPAIDGVKVAWHPFGDGLVDFRYTTWPGINNLAGRAESENSPTHHFQTELFRTWQMQNAPTGVFVSYTNGGATTQELTSIINNNAVADTDSFSHSPTILVMVEGATPGRAFTGELVMHLEFVLRTRAISYGESPRSSPLTGTNALQKALEVVAPLKPTTADGRLTQQAYQAFADTTKRVVSRVAGGVKSVESALQKPQKNSGFGGFLKDVVSALPSIAKTVLALI